MARQVLSSCGAKLTRCVLLLYIAERCAASLRRNQSHQHVTNQPSHAINAKAAPQHALWSPGLSPVHAYALTIVYESAAAAAGAGEHVTQVLGDAAYLQAALRAGEVVWQQGLLRKGPGLCHGVAGNAYALLRLWKTTRVGLAAFLQLCCIGCRSDVVVLAVLLLPMLVQVGPCTHRRVHSGFVYQQVRNHHQSIGVDDGLQYYWQHNAVGSAAAKSCCLRCDKPAGYSDCSP
jgi:hypothetical protein